MPINRGLRGFPRVGTAFQTTLQRILGASSAGLVVGSPASGDLGVGQINAVDLAKNGVSLIRKQTLTSLDPWAVNTTHTAAHTLGVIPDVVILELECKTTDVEYAVGDKLLLPPSAINTNPVAVYQTIVTSTNVVFITHQSATPALLQKTSKGTAGLTAANWKLNIYVRAFAS